MDLSHICKIIGHFIFQQSSHSEIMTIIFLINHSTSKLFNYLTRSVSNECAKRCLYKKNQRNAREEYTYFAMGIVTHRPNLRGFAPIGTMECWNIRIKWGSRSTFQGGIFFSNGIFYKISGAFQVQFFHDLGPVFFHGPCAYK